MLDLERLKRIRLMRRPIGQILLAGGPLRLDYRLPRRTTIVLEGKENLPDGPCFLAMNHTDRYNYWPLQYQLWFEGLGFTATWVKGKYYESRPIGAFMDLMNNIPVPSRGYVIATEFRARTGRKPSHEEYRLLRDLVDRRRPATDPLPEGTAADLRTLVGDGVDFLAQFDALFQRMMQEVIRLNRKSVEELGLKVLVFPQGTRSRRLTRGHTGLVQMAQHLRAPIVPVGCNGSDRLYPGDSPFSSGGRAVYRIGPPIDLTSPELTEYAVPTDAVPLTRDATERFGDRYLALTDRVMDRINDLLDPEYQRAEAEADAVETGVERFLL